MSFLTVACGFWFGWLLRLCVASANDTASKALVVSPSQYFEGNDGPWSSFNIRVGTPEQVVRVLVSTASPESMVVLSETGCSASSFDGSSLPSNCAVSRGVLFNPNKSSTWEKVGTYAINGDGVGLEANLGYSLNAEFAFDSIGIGLTGPSLKNQTVAGIAPAEPLYLGIFGLNNQPVNFSTLGNYSSPSFLTMLKSQGLIPSISWSYTAGAQYRLKQVYGQLIFSGYDTSRFRADRSVSFTMAGDVTRDLVVILQSISYSGSGEATLLSDPIDIYIDSTDPNLWLPDAACDAFEKAFGLTADSATGLYLVNDTHHTSLLNSGAEVSFRLSDVKGGGETVTITLPYDSFALTAKPPLVNTSSYYFPLKRAANSTQYTLGRTFLQEAYLSADYERGIFNISACSWNAGATENIVTIPPKDGAVAGDGGSSSSAANPAGLSPGAIAGIVIGSVVFVALVGIIIALIIRRRNLVITYAARDPVPDEAVMSGPVFNFNSSNLRSDVPTGSSPAHTVSETTAGDQANGLSGQEVRHKVSPESVGDEQQIHELPGEPISSQTNDTARVHELPGSRVPAAMAEARPTAFSTGALPYHGDAREPVQDSPSPIVSTMDATGFHVWNRGDQQDLVSPSTPVHHEPNSS